MEIISSGISKTMFLGTYHVTILSDGVSSGISKTMFLVAYHVTVLSGGTSC